MQPTEAALRYTAAKEYVETIMLALTSPHHIGQHVMMAVRPTHLLAGFALELYFKAWLLGDGVESKVVERFGHRLQQLHSAAVGRSFPTTELISELVDALAAPHGEDRDYVFRYTKPDAKIDPLDWPSVIPTFHSIDRIVDLRIGASASAGLDPDRQL